MRLDYNVEQARRACEAVQGTFRDGASCEPKPAGESLETAQPSSLRHVAVKFDRFGRAKEISAEYTVADAALPELIKTLVSELSSVLGPPAAGELAWCSTAAACASARYADWQFEGGEVRLESERRDELLALKLTHSHRDMTEQVQYGLPVCGP